MKTQDMPRRKHSQEFKSKLVKLCETSGLTVGDVARENGINVNLLYRWCYTARQARDAKSSSNRKSASR